MATGVKSNSTTRPERLLGAYLFALCLYQIGIYCWPGGPPFILDPRAGIPVLLINHFSFDNKIIYPVEWITAAEALLGGGSCPGRAHRLLHWSAGGTPWRRFRSRI
jgi:hypothetical protein